MSSTTSGRVRTKFSLQPSRNAPPKSPAVRCLCCSIVPIAPSSTRIRSESNSRRAFADSFKLRIREEPQLLTGLPLALETPAEKAAFGVHPYFTQVPSRNRTPCSELVLFRRERSFQRPDLPEPKCDISFSNGSGPFTSSPVKITPRPHRKSTLP